MARMLDPDKHAFKRDQILDAAMNLILTKGFDRMTIQDILDGLRISRGAFYHYFDSKQAVLDAYIERIRVESEKPLLPIVSAPDLTPLEKLRAFFDALDSLRTEHKADILRISQVWYLDGNALVREKVNQAILEQRARLLTAIIRQGAAEDAFSVPFPGQTGEVVYALFMSMGAAHSRLMLSLASGADPAAVGAEIVALYHAFMGAIERTLGVPDASLRRIDVEAVLAWVRIAQAAQA